MRHLGQASLNEQMTRDQISFAEWGQLLTLEQYLRREHWLRSQPWSKTQMQTWLLRDDQQIYSSCESFRMQSSFKGVLGHTYGIASVLTEPKLRSMGYATELLNLLQAKIKVDDPKAQAIVLYSDVGVKIYEKSGFYGLASTDWTFTASSDPDFIAEHRITSDDLVTVVETLNESYLTGAMQGKGFTIGVSSDQIRWHLAREQFYQDQSLIQGKNSNQNSISPKAAEPRTCLSEQTHGAKVNDSLLLWSVDPKSRCLQVLSLKFDNQSDAQDLIGCAKKQAADLNLGEVRIWSSESLTTCSPLELGGRLSPRQGQIPMIAPLADELSPHQWQPISKCAWV